MRKLHADKPNCTALRSSANAQPGTTAGDKTYARTHRLSVTLDQVHSRAATLAETTPPANAPLPPLATPSVDEDAASTGNTPISRDMPHL